MVESTTRFPFDMNYKFSSTHKFVRLNVPSPVKGLIKFSFQAISNYIIKFMKRQFNSENTMRAMVIYIHSIHTLNVGINYMISVCFLYKSYIDFQTTLDSLIT